ncbi:putative histidine kinase-group viii protein [Golovinomyces cichoracearum]|uniref:Putative histidine kinase-group viii protein n=1 Tax=Golovinomyces cichoracearum TaxID=62708 RepID=A0A420IQY6_9PEZI|nr:putative histidine kinase-group viii protein [Golovinomyces cichoracearum]
MRSTMRQLLGGKKSHKLAIDENSDNCNVGPNLSSSHNNIAPDGMGTNINQNGITNETSGGVMNVMRNGMSHNYVNTPTTDGFRNNTGEGTESSFYNSMSKGNAIDHNMGNNYGNPIMSNMGMRNNSLGTGQDSNKYYSKYSNEGSENPSSLDTGTTINNANNTYLSPHFERLPASPSNSRTTPSRASAMTGMSSVASQQSAAKNEYRKITERSQIINQTASSPPLVSTGIESTSTSKNYLRCEDEPIRVPGTIQSIGALIGLRYSENGDLEVRVASENSRKILGYGPEQLFALGSFLDVLEDPSRQEIIIQLDHCIRSGHTTSTATINPSFFQITLKFPYEPDCRLWCTIHQAPNTDGLIICEFEEYSENYYLKDVNATKSLPQIPFNSSSPDVSPEEFQKSTTSVSKPIAPLKIAEQRDDKLFSSLDIFCCLSRIQEQIKRCNCVKEAQDVIVGLVSEVTGFHRVMCYQFDNNNNGSVEAELVNPNASTDIFRGLHYPESDIPPQARELYKVNLIRLLFDRDDETSRLVWRDGADYEDPLDLTHCYLRAMSPIHLKYLRNMGVRSTLNISLVVDDKLWGLISCHGYGEHGIRVSLPIRELCRCIGNCASTNIERLTALERLRSRRLPQYLPANSVPPSSDLLKLIEADFAVLNIGNKVRAIGRMEPFQEATIIINYLQSCRVDRISSSQNIKADFPDISPPNGINTIAGILIIPLNIGKENDFLVFFRKGQLRTINWAGNPREKIFKSSNDYLEPRASFKRFTEIVNNSSKEWTEDQLDTASILALIYGRFAETWRMKASSAYSKDKEGEERDTTSARVDDTFNLKAAATRVLEALKKEAQRKALDLTVSIHEDVPTTVIGDADCFKQVMLYFIRNGFRSSQSLKVDVSLIRVQDDTSYVELRVQDAGPGMTEEELDVTYPIFIINICLHMVQETFQEFERAQSNEKWPFPNHPSPPNPNEVNRGSVTLSVVATFVRSINGQIQVTSEIGKGTIFTVEFPYKCANGSESSASRKSRNYLLMSPVPPKRISPQINSQSDGYERNTKNDVSTPTTNSFALSPASSNANENPRNLSARTPTQSLVQTLQGTSANENQAHISYEKGGYKPNGNEQSQKFLEKKFNILIADNDANSSRMLESKLLSAGYSVEVAHDGQECHDRFALNPSKFDVILMELKMPLVDGVLSTRMIRIAEKEAKHRNGSDTPQIAKQRVTIIAFSSILEEESRFDYIQSGFDGWLLKPVNIQRLDQMLQGLVDPKLRTDALYVPGQLNKGGWFLP